MINDEEVYRSRLKYASSEALKKMKERYEELLNMCDKQELFDGELLTALVAVNEELNNRYDNATNND